jgi:hypothetical protein
MHRESLKMSKKFREDMEPIKDEIKNINFCREYENLRRSQLSIDGMGRDILELEKQTSKKMRTHTYSQIFDPELEDLMKKDYFDVKAESISLDTFDFRIRSNSIFRMLESSLESKMHKGSEI